MLMVQIEQGVTIEALDEAITHMFDLLKQDEYGNRMTWQKKKMLQECIDDLLDARLDLMSK